MSKFRITLRDLFWLVTLAAVGLGWWMNNRSLHAKYDDASYQQHLTALKTELEATEKQIKIGERKAFELIERLIAIQREIASRRTSIWGERPAGIPSFAAERDDELNER